MALAPSPVQHDAADEPLAPDDFDGVPGRGKERLSEAHHEQGRGCRLHDGNRAGIFSDRIDRDNHPVPTSGHRVQRVEALTDIRELYPCRVQQADRSLAVESSRRRERFGHASDLSAIIAGDEREGSPVLLSRGEPESLPIVVGCGGCLHILTSRVVRIHSSCP